MGEYLPYMIYKYPLNRWTVIHDKLNQVMSKRKVQIKFLVNDHASHAKLMFDALKELKGDFFEAKMFKSTFDKKHFHGSHTKYMVTDTAALIGTSNWSGDYFSDTAGVSVIMEPIASTVNPKKISLLGTLKRIFERDFYSSLAKKIY